jgi:ATP-dependent Clp protease adaptor protein ClpS
MIDEDILELSDVSIDTFINNKLIVYNDNNTFEWVITCFTKYLQMGSEQAEQCALIIHHKGKTSVKHGTVEELTPFKVALSDAGLTVEIE